MELLLKYFDKNNIGLTNSINSNKYHALFILFESRSANIQDWLNLLSNVCNQCKTNFKKEHIDNALDFVKKFRDEFDDIDYESMIVNKFKQPNNESMN